MLFSLHRLSLHRHSRALKPPFRVSTGDREKPVLLWILGLVAGHTRAEDVLGTVAEPGHGQCRAAVHAGPEQRWARLVCRCGNIVGRLDCIELNCLAKENDIKSIQISQSSHPHAWHVSATWCRLTVGNA